MIGGCDDHFVLDRVERDVEMFRPAPPGFIEAPAPLTIDDGPEVTAQAIVTVAGEEGGFWLLALWMLDSLDELVARERAWYEARGVRAPVHPWYRRGAA